MPGGALVRSVEVSSRVDQRDVRKRLRKVTQEALRHRIVLFREETYVVAQTDEVREESAGIVHASEQIEAIHEPEGASEKSSFTGRKAVDTRRGRVALNEAVAHQVALDGEDGATHPRVLCRKKANQRDHQQARV